MGILCDREQFVFEQSALFPRMAFCPRRLVLSLRMEFLALAVVRILFEFLGNDPPLRLQVLSISKC